MLSKTNNVHTNTRTYTIATISCRTRMKEHLKYTSSYKKSKQHRGKERKEGSSYYTCIIIINFQIINKTFIPKYNISKQKVHPNRCQKTILWFSSILIVIHHSGSYTTCKHTWRSPPRQQIYGRGIDQRASWTPSTFQHSSHWLCVTASEAGRDSTSNRFSNSSQPLIASNVIWARNARTAFAKWRRGHCPNMAMPLLSRDRQTNTWTSPEMSLNNRVPPAPSRVS